ncbi:hypothetical protein PGQ11_009077 [Apiospora arundinis]|uniref:Uncharacterized protein n=1 Tax=Apiospora arundinis TaxID=335852 RepID=A0ABR2IHM6_9PEZI
MPRYYIPAVATDAKQHENKQELVRPDSREVQNIIHHQSQAVPQSYDWDANMCEFKQQARHEGLEELPASQVGRVIEEGKLTGLFDVGHIMYGAREFVVYDGFDVLARVEDVTLINLVLCDLATHHVGRLGADIEHPSDVELVVKKEMMQDSEERIIGWAVLIQPKVIPEKRRKPAEGQPQSAQQQKRFAN